MVFGRALQRKLTEHNNQNRKIVCHKHFADFHKKKFQQKNLRCKEFPSLVHCAETHKKIANKL